MGWNLQKHRFWRRTHSHNNHQQSELNSNTEGHNLRLRLFWGFLIQIGGAELCVYVDRAWMSVYWIHVLPLSGGAVPGPSSGPIRVRLWAFSGYQHPDCFHISCPPTAFENLPLPQVCLWRRRWRKGAWVMQTAKIPRVCVCVCVFRCGVYTGMFCCSQLIWLLSIC